ncbi:MAG: extracellular solute-binding protein [Geminicoccaceae bacterium]
MIRPGLRTALLGGALLFLAGAADAGTLVINADTSDPAPRAAWEAAVQQFQKENPDVEVKFNVYDHESYKKSIRNWLTSASPDVVFWYVGNRMGQFVKPSLLEDVSSVYTDDVKGSLSQAALDLVTVDGKQYGVAYTYYQWGLYYRKDLLDKAGITAAPTSWNGLLEACEKLNASGVAPIAIGSKDLWPTAGWFDYIDLRENGYDFHMQLMGGSVPYTDQRVKNVFGKWKELLDKNCFVKNHASVSWQESQALLYQGKAAMMLIGNFIAPNFPPEVADKMAFAPFPMITEGVALAEDAPMDSVHVPAKAQNKEDAKKFLAFVARADVQEAINKALLQIPVNKNAGIADDRFLVAGKELLGQAQHIAQFFDRDTSEDLATIGMKGFQEFMIKPDRIDAVLDNLERARKRIYKQ